MTAKSADISDSKAGGRHASVAPRRSAGKQLVRELIRTSTRGRWQHHNGNCKPLIKSLKSRRRDAYQMHGCNHPCPGQLYCVS